MTDTEIVTKSDFYDNVRDILQRARDNAYRQVNFTMVEAYWNMRQFYQLSQFAPHCVANWLGHTRISCIFLLQRRLRRCLTYKGRFIGDL